MCTFIEKRVMNGLRKRKSGRIVAFKHFKMSMVTAWGVHYPYKWTVVGSNLGLRLRIDSSGFIHSDRKRGTDLSIVEIRDGHVNHGIHCYREDFEADSGEFLVPVFGEIDDMIAAEKSRICFTKVRIRKADLTKAVRADFNRWSHPADVKHIVGKCYPKKKVA
ncbi:MAG: hypothetical protein CMG78_12075 [Marinobacter sp.]|nr:hypothetical protein [Marinobacter sp.]|tara:strand:+ start:1775 stop:2263 length:489 start_codon:yes stop_codon:yes gene_type:complete